MIHGVAEAPEGGSVQITGGPAAGPVGEGPGTKAAGAVFTQGTETNAGGSDVASFSVQGPPPDGTGKGPLVLDDQDARQGTDAECAALRPDVQRCPDAPGTGHPALGTVEHLTLGPPEGPRSPVPVLALPVPLCAGQFGRSSSYHCHLFGLVVTADTGWYVELASPRTPTARARALRGRHRLLVTAVDHGPPGGMLVSVVVTDVDAVAARVPDAGGEIVPRLPVRGLRDSATSCLAMPTASSSTSSSGSGPPPPSSGCWRPAGEPPMTAPPSTIGEFSRLRA